ncbi:hypothetical protein K6W37_15855 [Acetobacter senegalensis]|uniref:hypothetical protein n=1 Tax=Acetobacter senegalensis TaxID=446692 RepID=UPI001EDB8737|nr:hypothetical protein [Acetobacter senegalensis]MCG4255334.1 hypothetical protein [Acetobacter senegalensis]
MSSKNKEFSIPLNTQDRFLNFRMQALLLECLTPEATRLPQTLPVSFDQSVKTPQRHPSLTAWLRVAQIVLEQDLRETLAASPPDGQSFRSLFMSQQDDELSQISRNSLFEQLDTLKTVYKTRYQNKEYSDFFQNLTPHLFLLIHSKPTTGCVTGSFTKPGFLSVGLYTSRPAHIFTIRTFQCPGDAADKPLML